MQKDWWRRQLRITWHLPAVVAALGFVFLLVFKWNWLTSHPPRVIRLSGSHYEMGLQHGRIHGLIIGRNLDWINHKVAHKSGVVFILEPKDGYRILSVSWPGIVGVVTGMNDRQLTISLNMAYAGDLETEATPCLFRLRRALEQEEDLETAIRKQIQEPRTIAMNLLIASGREGRAAVLELSGHQHAVVPMKDHRVVTTNFYQMLPIRGGSGSERNAILNQSVVFVPGELAAYVAIGQFPATSGRYYRISLD